MKELEDIRTEILKEIKPTDGENLKIQKLIALTIDAIEKWNSKHENLSFNSIIPQGSTGIKQTHLKGAADIDLFIFLDPEDYWTIIFPNEKNKKNNKPNRKSLETFFKRYCRDWIIPALKGSNFTNVILSYAEHPYVSAVYDDFDIDIVFAFLVSKEYLNTQGPITAVDRTYHHTEFIKNNFSERQKDDVRILKKFFKSQFSYGDKAPIGRGGFIGYSAELLIHHYKDIWTVFEHFEELPNTPIDVFNRNENELRTKSRLKDDFLLIMDPTDKKRNVAASISPQSWIFCSKVIQKFQETHDIKLMLKPDIQKSEKWDERAVSKYFILEFQQISDDHYTKIRDKLYSVSENLRTFARLESSGAPKYPDTHFSVYVGAESGKFAVAFFTNCFDLEPEYIRRGPNIKNPISVSKFLAKHKDAFLQDNYYCIIEKRKYTRFDKLIKENFDFQKMKELKRLNISKVDKLRTIEGKMAVYVLDQCILPFKEELINILRKKKLLKTKRLR